MTDVLRLLGIARADFRERIRRHAFLVTLGFTVYAAYLFLPPNDAPYATLRFGEHRGLYNSAWVGTLTALMSATFLSFAGFYLVKNAIERDRRTRVGPILAATPISKLAYLTGKALSNFAVLAVMVAVVIVSAAWMQQVRGEDTRLDLAQLILPFLLLTLPAMAAVSAVAVLFESIPFLRGGLGNVAYFVLWNVSLASAASRREPGGLDLAGFGQVLPILAQACHIAFPDYDPLSGQMSLGFNFRREGVWHFQTFTWEGLRWTEGMVAARLIWAGVALAMLALAAVVFDRFDEQSSAPRARPRRRRELSAERAAVATGTASAAPRLGPIQGSLSFSLLRGIGAELRLMRSDVRPAWLVVAAGLMMASLFVPWSGVARFVLPALWIWPLLHWSVLGTREARHDTAAMLFSTPRPLARPLLAQWMAGVVLALVLAGGVGVRLAASGDVRAIVALLAGALFVPALAVAFGTWTGSGKLFEVLYLLIWYVGPLNRVAFLDFTGLSAPAPLSPLVWGGGAFALLTLALAGRSLSLRA